MQTLNRGVKALELTNTSICKDVLEGVNSYHVHRLFVGVLCCHFYICYFYNMFWA
jgi:hypothetical protein